LILEHIFDIQSKIISVNCGSEVNSDVCSKLFRHFTEHGTPVMVGGAVGGAITVIGIDITTQRRPHSSLSNGGDNARFLMLDPHYVGPDEPDKLLASGHWCYWVDARVYFQEGAFYNFCLPQASKSDSGCNGSSIFDVAPEGSGMFDGTPEATVHKEVRVTS
jgi:hypothetical protein